MVNNPINGNNFWNHRRGCTHSITSLRVNSGFRTLSDELDAVGLCEISQTPEHSREEFMKEV